MRKTALILGAGASKAFGLPLTTEIFPGIWKRIHQKKLLPQEQRSALIRLIKNMYPGIRTKDCSYLPNITEILSMVDHLIANQNTPTPRLQVNELIDCRRFLEIATIKFIEEDFYVYDKTNEQDQLYDKFIHWIYKKRQRGCNIISTNYDITVEFGLQDYYTYESFAKSVDFGFTWRDPYSGKLRTPPLKPIYGIYKLHGSTNWLRCDLCDQIYVHIEGNLFHNTLVKKLTNNNTCHCGHGRLSSVIVSPSLVRVIKNSNLNYVWYRALEKLRTANEWIIIGYSMPSEDLNIKSILMRAFSGRRSKPKITVVQYDDNDECFRYNKARFEAQFGKVTYYRWGVKSFLSKR